MAHAVRRIEESLFAAPAAYDGHATGVRRADLIGAAEGSVHMRFSLAELAPGGSIDSRVCTFETGIFVLDGEVELNREASAVRLAPNDYALIPVGVAHAFRNRGANPVRWIEKTAPQPKPPGAWQDSFFVKPLAWPDDAAIQLPGTPIMRLAGHFDPAQLPPPGKGDAHRRGQSKKMLLDRAFGSQHFDLFIIEFAAGGQSSMHDHNFEEAYFILDGEVTFTAEGSRHVLRPGMVAWSGVGAPHAFHLDRGTACRWLEVMSPQPPLQNVGRRFAVWDGIRQALQV